LISEVVFKLGGSAEEGEWIELYNPSSYAVDLSNWTLGDAVRYGDYERRYAFPAGAVIAPGETLVVARQAEAYQALEYRSRPVPDFEWRDSNSVRNLVRTAWGDGEFALGNAGDEVLLSDPAGVPIDVFVYGRGTYPDHVPFGNLGAVYNGNSLERWPAHRDSDDCRRDFRIRYSPEPGSIERW
jgi:hypothetical protein